MSLITVFFIMLQVIILDGILSIDNAAALAAIASKLPKNTPSPLPSWLSWLGKQQQQAALRIGIFGAYIGRGLMLLLAGFIIHFSILQLVGAGYLLYLAYKGLAPSKDGEEEESGFAKRAGVFWHTVILIELADLAFSLDNVVAVAALSQYLWIIILGVFISIIIMRFAAGIFIKLIVLEPLLEKAAYVLILAIGLELIAKFFGHPVDNLLQFEISMAILALTVVVGQLKRKVAWIFS